VRQPDQVRRFEPDPAPGSNTYSGGALNCPAARWSSGNNSAISSGAGSVLPATAPWTAPGVAQQRHQPGWQLTLAGNQNTTLIGAITGTGSLVKNGSGDSRAQRRQHLQRRHDAEAGVAVPVATPAACKAPSPTTRR
jgi:hypothetical protein